MSEDIEKTRGSNKERKKEIQDRELRAYFKNKKEDEFKSTWRGYRETFIKLEEWIEEQDDIDSWKGIDQYAFSEFKSDKLSHLSIGAKQQHIGRFRSFLRDNGKEDTAENIDYPHTEKTLEQREERTDVLYLEVEEYDKILNACESLREELIIKVLWNCGLRRAEIAELRCKDVNLDEEYLKVDTKKNDEFRDVPFSFELKTTLRDWLQYGGRDQYKYASEPEYLIVTQHSAQVRPNYITKVVRRVAQRTSVNRKVTEDAKGRTRWFPTPRHFRNSYATLRAQSGINLETLRDLMGHKDVETTAGYCIIDIDSKKEANEKHKPQRKSYAETLSENL